MQNDTNKEQLFYDYYQQWIEVYKRGAIRDATMAKYLMTQKWVQKLAPNLKVSELTRTAYQKLLNDYAKEHERQTTLDFHHQLKGAVLDAVDEGLIERDPTRKAIIKGKTDLVGCEVTATDLRGGASMMVCGLIAEGITIIDNIHYIERGYDNIIKKLNDVGAKIELI